MLVNQGDNQCLAGVGKPGADMLLQFARTASNVRERTNTHALLPGRGCTARKDSTIDMEF
jgi:hypothetical protein